MITVYASVGNSDDKLTQARWSEFVGLFVIFVKAHASEVHGVWHSAPDAPWQNACVCFELDGDGVQLRRELAQLCGEYGQDSIAWAVADTSFIEPSKART